MIILDTDHFTVLRYPEHSQCEVLSVRMRQSADTNFATTPISVEEQMRGWLAAIRRARRVHDQILYYTRLVGMIRYVSKWQILPFNEPAADRFEALRKQRVRIGTQDLKIASIGLEAGALLLSAQTARFRARAGAAGRELAAVI